MNKEKMIIKYMKLAKTLAEDNSACYSRKIGVFISKEDGTPVSMGYNGSIAGAPHNDSREYLEHLWENLITNDDRRNIIEKIGSTMENGEFDFVNKYENCKTCPRKLLDIPSGQRMELCNCSHAERNAIFNAAVNAISTKDAIMYCWCGVPCHECSIAICQSKIKEVHCLKTTSGDYSISSRGIFKMSNVNLVEHDRESF